MRLFELLSDAWLYLAVALLAIVLLRSWRMHTRIEPGSFGDDPARYHKCIVEISGSVERIIADAPVDWFGRRFSMAVQRWLRITSPQLRVSHHLRFLLSSDELTPGEFVMIEHNMSSPIGTLNEGVSVTVRGEYIHRRTSSFRPISGRLFGAPVSTHRFRSHPNKYGVIHFTHPPKGYVIQHHG